MSKREVRLRALKARRSLMKEQLESRSAAVQERLLSIPEFSKAAVIASYVAKSDEVQTKGIIETALSSGKRVLVPRTAPDTLSLRFSEIRSLDELSPGHFGVLEPPESSKAVSLSNAQIVLVPVVAWDAHGGRVGYGKGYFDRELKARGNAIGIGLALESQRFAAVPSTPHDVPLDMIVTEKRTLRFGRDSG